MTKVAAPTYKVCVCLYDGEDVVAITGCHGFRRVEF